MLLRRQRLPWRLLLLYLAVLTVSLALLLARPAALPGLPPAGDRAGPERVPGGGDSSTSPAVPALAAGESRRDAGAGAPWADLLLRLGLPLLDAYDLPPLLNSRGLAGLLAGTFPLRILRAQMPVLALEESEGPAPPEAWRPLPLPYVPPDAGSALAPVSPLPPPAHPLVIVYHTHAQESFLPSLKAAGKGGDSPYSGDDRLNVVRVGEELARTLQEQYGIPTLHLWTHFDANGLTGAYMESLKGVEEAMARYASARVLLDIHRDSSGREATVTVVGGKPVARVMFVLGKGNPHLPNPHWRENEAFGDAIARALDAAVAPDPLPASYAGTPGQRFPPLVRQLQDGDGDPWTFARDGRFNQHLSPRAILIEIGGPENTVPEALRAARLVARAVAAVLKGEAAGTRAGQAE